MALVEIEAGPFLVTAAITGDSVRELGLAPAVPRDSKITGLGALERPGVSVAVGAPTVPVGSYAAKALALAWGRALGWFGATLMFAGSFQGVTQTAPLAIYDRFASDFPAALALSAVLVIVSAVLLLTIKLGSGPPVVSGG